MSYTSTVAIRCETQVAQKIKQVIAPMQELLPLAILQEDSTTLFYWENQKWYRNDPYYEWVEAIHDILKEADLHEEEPDWGYYYVRLGESFEDIERETNDYELEIPLSLTIPDGIPKN